MPVEPTDVEIIQAALESRLLDVHTCLPGRVVSYNPATQTADIQPLVKRAIRSYAGELVHETLPVVHDVPVEWPGGGGFAMIFPVAPGDHMWLIFSEAATAKWRSTGQISEPGDLRRHDLSYACAVYSRGPASGALQPLSPSTQARMDCPNPFVFGSQASAQFVALSNKVDAAMDLIKTHIHPTAMGPSGPDASLNAIESSACTKLKAQ
jgi:hypothetical protein